MLRRKLFNRLLLIICSLITACNIEKTPGSVQRYLAAIDTMISHKPVFTPSDFVLNPAALEYAKEYIDKNSWGLEKLKERSRSRLTVINSVFSQFDIPQELKYVAIVESNLDTDTVCNSSGATGLWQLMPVTARELGLQVNDNVDERLHVRKSSQAAAKYMKQLYAEFGDWLLVIAAYNSGPVKVNRAIDQAGHKNFWQLQNFLPTETRNHVKRFLSVLYYFEEGKAVTQQTIV